MTKQEQLQQLITETKVISSEIATLKKEFNRMPAGTDKLKLKEQIVFKQHQALFYLEKMANLNQEIKEASD